MTALASARPKWIAVLAAWALLAPAGVALAQAPAEEKAQAQKPEAEAPAPEPPKILEEITVTAQKREENIQQVPLSVTTFDADQLALLTGGGADVKALSARVPSLLLESSFGRAFPRFYIRGLGNTDFDLNASQPVSMVVDDVVLENPVVKGMPLFDLQRTEVLRGPQGSIFGRNTPAGVVKFQTVRPSQELDGFARVSYGTYDNVDFKAAVGGGLTDTLSARASLLYQSQSDWIDNTFTGQDDALGGQTTWAGRLQLLWEPSEKFQALFNVHGWDLDGTARIFRANILEKGTDELVAGFEQDEVSQDGLNQQEIRAYGGVLKLDYDFGSATLTSVTGYETLDKMYSRGDIDGGYGAVFAPPSGPGLIPFPSESADGLPKLDQFTQELRLASDTKGRWDWLLGFYYFDESLQADTFSYTTLAPGNPVDGYAFQTQDASSWARFASVDFRPTDRWTLKGGLRYTTDQKDFSAERPDPTFQLPTLAPDPGLDRRRPRHLGPLGHLQGDRERQPVQPRGHRLPRALDPGAHPLLRRLRGRHEPGDELRLRRRRGEDHLVRGRREDRDRPQAAPERRRLRLPGRRAADRGGGRPVQHRDPAQRRQVEGLRPRGRPRLGALVGLALHARRPPTTTPRSTTRTSRSRSAAAAARSPTRSSTAWRASTATRCRTPRSGSSAASSTTATCSGRVSSRPARTGPTTARRASSSTSRRSSWATRSSSARASATPSARGASRSPPSGAT